MRQEDVLDKKENEPRAALNLHRTVQGSRRASAAPGLLLKLAAAAMMSAGPVMASATGLMEVWLAAQSHDPQGRVLMATRDAGATQADLASALWRPTLGLSASTGLGGVDSRTAGASFTAPGFGASRGVEFATSVNAGTAYRVGVVARQPLFDAERSARSRGLDIGAQAAEIQWQAGRQEWVLQLTKHYFDLLLAQRRQALLQRQLEAVERAAAEARDRYTLGDAPVTDVHEAAARLEDLRAQAVAVRAEQSLARSVLADLSGLPAASLHPLAPPLDVSVEPGFHTLVQWQQWAREEGPTLRMLDLQLQAAQADTARHRTETAATVDLLGSVTRERVGGSGDYGSASNLQQQSFLGVAVNVPLYTGGARSAQLRMALQQEERLRAERDRAALQLDQQVRSAWTQLQSGSARVGALAEALKAAQARLDATRLGRQVGDRTTLNLLQAENEAAAADLAWLQARVMVLTARLQLMALAGRLNETQLQQVSQTLQDLDAR